MTEGPDIPFEDAEPRIPTVLHIYEGTESAEFPELRIRRLLDRLSGRVLVLGTDYERDYFLEGTRMVFSVFQSSGKDPQEAAAELTQMIRAAALQENFLKPLSVEWGYVSYA